MSSKLLILDLKKKKKKLTMGPVEGIGSTVGMQPYLEGWASSVSSTRTRLGRPARTNPR